MPRYVFAARTNAVVGREAEFDAWYSGTHLADMKRLPGVVSVRRFALADVQVRDEVQPFGYLALYEVETDDPRTFVSALLERAGTDRLPTHPSLAPGASAVLWQSLLDE